MQHSGLAHRDADVRRWGLLGAGMIAIAAAIVSYGIGGFFQDGAVPSWVSTSYVVLVYTGVGIMILWRRPGHGIGRLALAIGLAFSVSTVLDGCFQLALRQGLLRGLAPDVFLGIRDTLPLVGDAVRIIALVFGGVLLLAWFPDGRAAGRAGRAVHGLLIACAALLASTYLREPIARLIGSTRALDWTFDAVGFVATMCVLAAFGIAVVDLMRRYRHADPVRRAQIRWVLAAAGLTAVLTAAVMGSIVLAVEITGLWEIWVASWLVPVLAIGIAVTRYHLYDIDRIVSQGIAYTIVTGALFAVIAIGVVALPVVLTPQLGDDGVAVAVSTLIAAALFQPLRSRVQAIVDRRFNRARYDAERTAVDFADRLRDEVEIDTVTSDLRSTVTTALRPMKLDMWLRDRPR